MKTLIGKILNLLDYSREQGKEININFICNIALIR